MCDFQLVDPSYLSKRLAQPPRGGQAWVLLEAHFTSIDHPLTNDYQEWLHIPSAIRVHPSYLEVGADRSKYYPCYTCPADGNLLPDHELVAALELLGISPDTLVIVYGSEPDGTMAAARLIWGLMYAGVTRIRLLDGGLDAWLASGGNTVSRVEEAWQRRIAPAARSSWQGMRTDFLATTKEVFKISQAATPGASKLVDVRRRGEWDGSAPHYYPFFNKAGHIPNAIYQGDWDNLLDMSSHKLGPKLGAVAERWRAQGIIDERVAAGTSTLIFYCGTGWRSSISFLVALLLGLRARNYDGGFYAWSWDKENPIVVGKDLEHMPQIEDDDASERTQAREV